MYPRAKVDAGIRGMPASGVAHDVPLVLDTNDSVHLVDLRYRSNARGCERTAQGGGGTYRCASKSIMITMSDTQIAFVPGFRERRRLGAYRDVRYACPWCVRLMTLA